MIASYKSVASGSNPHVWIEDIKISPDSQLVAFGTHGGNPQMEVLQVKSSGKSVKLYKKINTRISGAFTHLDWSEDSQTVVLNSGAYELLWFNVHSGERVYASSAKDVQFASWTCLLGFPVQGIWPGIDYTDVNSTCRSVSR